jgi:hypothetical protein
MNLPRWRGIHFRESLGQGSDELSESLGQVLPRRFVHLQPIRLMCHRDQTGDMWFGRAQMGTSGPDAARDGVHHHQDRRPRTQRERPTQPRRRGRRRRIGRHQDIHHRATSRAAHGAGIIVDRVDTEVSNGHGDNAAQRADPCGCADATGYASDQQWSCTPPGQRSPHRFDVVVNALSRDSLDRIRIPRLHSRSSMFLWVRPVDATAPPTGFSSVPPIPGGAPAPLTHPSELMRFSCPLDALCS